VAPPGELRVKAGVVWLLGNTVWSTPERIRGEILTTMRFTFTFTLLTHMRWLALPLPFSFAFTKFEVGNALSQKLDEEGNGVPLRPMAL